MAIVEAFFGLITRPAGRILKAIFGWAVRALFGPSTARAQTFLSVVVAAAVAWSVVLAGLVAPNLARLTVRTTLGGAALLIPPIIGISLAPARPARGESRIVAILLALLRGFPVTVGLAAAFLITFLSAPVIRLGALWRGRQSADMPLATSGSAYHDVAGTIFDALNRHGLALRRVAPRWSIAASSRLLTWVSGNAFRSYLPSRLEHFASSDLELTLYPNGLRICGEATRLALAHGLIAELVTHTDGLQTAAPKARDLELRLRQLWRSYDETPAVIVGAENHLQSLEQITRELGALKVDLDDWQVLYRQILQVGRAIHGQRQLMDVEVSTMASEWDAKTPVDKLSDPSWGTLITHPRP
jgi:hypothetical protein